MITLKQGVVVLVMAGIVAGCKDTEKQKALAEAAQARIEIAKQQAEIVTLRGERAYLHEKLQTAEQTREQLQQQLDDLFQQQEEIIADANNAEQLNARVVTMLEEQARRASTVDNQNRQLTATVEQLNTVVKQQQATIEQQKKEIEQLKAGVRESPREPNEVAVATPNQGTAPLGQAALRL